MPNQSPLEFDLDDHLAAAREILAGSTPQALLTAHASLTHRMHAADDGRVEDDLRAQRSMIEAEIRTRLEQPRQPVITEQDLNRAAQRAYDSGLLKLPSMTDKPRVVAMLCDVLGSLGVALPDGHA
jgi:hypothetical protein